MGNWGTQITPKSVELKRPATSDWFLGPPEAPSLAPFALHQLDLSFNVRRALDLSFQHVSFKIFKSDDLIDQPSERGALQGLLDCPA